MNKDLLKRITCKLEEKEEIKRIAQHHIDSFNFAMKDVLKILHKYIRPIEIKSTEKTEKLFKTMTISYAGFELGYLY
jgi:hypothetical protein